MPESAFAKTMAAQVCAAFLFVAGGCATFAPALEARAKTESWARERGFAAAPLRAGDFDLYALTRQSASAETLTVYIEGDGAPWSTPYHPPRDPTPRDPLALAMASADTAPQVAWLARPCQYLSHAALQGCDSAYWLERRFAPEVIVAYDSAVTQLKTLSGARHVRLVGYSGGGVIAALVAMRRADIASVVTVAAPLSLTEWTAWHDLSPLTGSLDPQRQKPTRTRVPDVHFAGANDKIVPAGIVERFVRSHGGRLEIVVGFDHHCCWVRDWSRLLSRARGMEDAK